MIPASIIRSYCSTVIGCVMVDIKFAPGFRLSGPAECPKNRHCCGVGLWQVGGKQDRNRFLLPSLRADPARTSMVAHGRTLSELSKSLPAGRPGTRSATASTRSGSGRTAVWRNGWPRNRAGQSPTEIPSRCCSGGSGGTCWDRRSLLCLGLELLSYGLRQLIGQAN